MIMLDSEPAKKSRLRSRKISGLSKGPDSMEMELNRFLCRIAQSRAFDGRQLFLPGFYPDQDTP